jgi:hypothetical protein
MELRAEPAELPEHDVVGGVGGNSAVRAEFVAEPGEEELESLVAGDEQGVRVASLRNPGPVVRVVGERVALQDGHGVEAVGEYPGGRQAGHTGADDNCAHRSIVPRSYRLITGCGCQLFAERSFT